MVHIQRGGWLMVSIAARFTTLS